MGNKIYYRLDSSVVRRVAVAVISSVSICGAVITVAVPCIECVEATGINENLLSVAWAKVRIECIAADKTKKKKKKAKANPNVCFFHIRIVLPPVVRIRYTCISNISIMYPEDQNNSGW